MAAQLHNQNQIINSGGAAAGSGGGSSDFDKENVNITYDMNDECPICLDDFIENSKLKYLTCGCGTRTCIPCAKEYLMNSTKDPHCHQCNRGWDRTFQYSNFGSSWVNNTYKKYRKTLILDREKARMPETVPYAKASEQIELYTERIKELTNSISGLRDRITEVEQLKWSMIRDRDILRGGGLINETVNDISNVDGTKKTVVRAQFIKACPNEDCRGFLSSAYKCGICNIFVCPKCFEIKGLNKNDPHECDENNVKAAELIKKETKPCPKCAVPIFKIHGCNQMWCTQCHVAFSWSTGRIENGVVHNPHFYEWARKNGNNTLNPGTIVCGGLVDYYPLHRIFSPLKKDHHITTEQLTYIDRLHRGARHTRYIIDNLRTDMNGNQDNRDLRIRYLRNQIDEAHLAKIATQRDNVREKKLAMLQLLELLNTIVIENFNDLYNNMSDLLKIHIEPDEMTTRVHTIIKLFSKNIETARSYVNNEMIKVGKNYKMKIYYVPYNFDIDNNGCMNTYSEIEDLLIIEKLTNNENANSMLNKMIRRSTKDLSKNLRTYRESLEDKQ